MAKARSGIFDKISGSIGGNQFRQTRYGTVIGLNTIPVNRRTSPKQTSNARFSNTSRLWAQVKPSQVEAWNKLADTVIKTDKLGNTYSMRNIDLFKHINRTLLEIGEPVIFSAPKKVFPSQLLSPRFDIKASPELTDIRLYFKSRIPKNTKIIIYATPMIKFGRNSPPPSKFRIIAILDHTFLSGYSLLKEYLTIFQTNVENSNRIAFNIRPVSCISGFSAPDYSVLQAQDSKPLLLKIKFRKSNIKYNARKSKPENY